MNLDRLSELADDLLPAILDAQNAVWPDAPHQAPRDDDDDVLEFRLHTVDGRSFDVLTGSPDYDTDHRGHWGAGVIGPDSEACDVVDAIVEAIDQCFESLAEWRA